MMDIESSCGSSGTSIQTVNASGIPVFEDIVVPPLPIDDDSVDNASGPRLMITKIVNKNFKSYAGTEILGPFHKNFTAIVGPNGSGKSNVIDSMLFVFGFRATKIRSKKISVLIHSSESYQNIESCTVSIHFQKIIDNGDNYTVVEGSQLIVERTAFKDSSSFYTINNKRVIFKEVGVLLRACGIDLDHNRFLILQGEVEQIAMMKPKALNENEDGMLEFLEDIIGSSRFKSAIEQLFKRVEELNEMRGEKVNRVNCVEKEKNELEEEKNEAEKFLTIENDVTKYKNEILQKMIYECEAMLKDYESKKASIVEEFKMLENKLTDITSQRKLKLGDHSKIVKRYSKLVKEKDLKNDEFKKCEEDDVRCVEDRKHCKTNIKKMEQSLQQEELKLKELKLIPDKQVKEAEIMEKRLGKLKIDKKTEQDKFDQIMEKFHFETKDFQLEKSNKEMELEKFQKNVNQAKQKFTLVQSELELFKSNQTKETNRLTEIKSNIDRIQKTFIDKKKIFEELSKKLPESTQAFEKSKKDLNEVIAVEHKKSDQVRSLRLKVEEARSNMNAARSQGKVLDFLMNLKRNGQLPGIYGRLGDLGAIDAKYDVAVSTACGYLDNIVVDNMSTAQKCIEQLKISGVGFTSFMGVDKMASWKAHCEKKINTPENVPRLFDLIEVKDKNMKPCFYFALRDTLVAKDLTQATRIAYGSTRYRVVTLNGELIDLSGTMTGGGTYQLRGKMGSKIVEDVDPRQVENLEQDLEVKTREVDGCRENKYKLQEMVDKLQSTHREQNNEFQKINQEVKALEEQLENLTKQVKGQELKVNNSAPDPKELNNMEINVAQLKKEYEKIQGVASKLEDEIHEIHEKIMDIGGSEMKTFETRISLIDTEIDQITGSYTKINVSIKTSERNMKKSEEKIVTVTKDLAECREKLSSLENGLKKIEAKASEILIVVTQLQEEIKMLEGEIAEIDKIASKFGEEENETKKNLIEVQHRLEQLETEGNQSKNKLNEHKRGLSNLSLNKINPCSIMILEKLKIEQLELIDCKQLENKINRLMNDLKIMKPNMASIDEYRKKEEIYLKRINELTQITELRNKQRKNYEELRKQRLNEFMSGFSKITNKLKEMYQMITLGGDAELELVDSLDPFTEGVVFSVRPPKKSWKNISNLSGGEKTLSSLALVFALHHYKPTPLYVMDEIDAALDFRNVSIVANYIKDRTKNAQFIVISLRNNMYELCNRLIGIYKTFNCTHSVIFDPSDPKHSEIVDEQNNSPTLSGNNKKFISQQTVNSNILSNQQSNIINITGNDKNKDSPLCKPAKIIKLANKTVLNKKENDNTKLKINDNFNKVMEKEKEKKKVHKNLDDDNDSQDNFGQLTKNTLGQNKFTIGNNDQDIFDQLNSLEQNKITVSNNINSNHSNIFAIDDDFINKDTENEDFNLSQDIFN